MWRVLVVALLLCASSYGRALSTGGACLDDPMGDCSTVVPTIGIYPPACAGIVRDIERQNCYNEYTAQSQYYEATGGAVAAFFAGSGSVVAGSVLFAAGLALGRFV
jgi:hypothetical protein